MFCKNCGAENSNEARFCKNCGEKIILHFGNQVLSNKRLKGFKKWKVVIFVLVIVCVAISIYFLWRSYSGNFSNATQNLINQVQSQKTVEFGEKKVNREMPGASNTIVDLDLALPKLTGTYTGIPGINSYYDDQEKKFNADAEDLSKEEPIVVYDEHSYVKAHFRLEAVVDNIISIVGDGDWHINGGAGSGSVEFFGDVFDLNTGKKLTLDDVFNVDSGEYLDVIYKKVSKQIKKDIENETSDFGKYALGDSFGPAKPSDVDSKRGKEAIRGYKPANFYITDKALVVFYETGSLGPNSSGPFKFEIPFESIKELLEIKLPADQSLKASAEKVPETDNTNKDLHTYTNDRYKYKFSYPDGAVIEEAKKGDFGLTYEASKKGLTLDSAYKKYTGKICLSVIYKDGAVIISAPANEENHFILCSGRTGIGSQSKTVSAKEDISIDGKTYTVDTRDITDDGKHNYLVWIKLEDGTRITISTSLLETKAILKNIVESYISTN